MVLWGIVTVVEVEPEKVKWGIVHQMLSDKTWKLTGCREK